MENLVSALALLGLSIFTSAQATISGDLLYGQSYVIFQKQILSSESLDLSTRYPDAWVNEVFSDNILLNLHYLKDDVENLKDEKGKIDWEKVRAPFDFSMRLEPGQTFAYHRNLLPEFKDKNVIVGKSRFWYDEGYKSDGYLVGDGICHLASLFNWVAQDARLPDGQAGLLVKSMVNHDFLPVPEIPREYGTSILYAPDGSRNSANQNLYITNNFDFPVEFEISVDGRWVEIKIVS